MILADTSYLLALFASNDERHSRASDLSARISEKVGLTDHVFSELITLLSRRSGSSEAYKVGTRILQSDLLILHVADEDLKPALETVKSHSNVSMCDAISAVVMKKLGIRKILSFDSDFDRLGFERIH